MQKIKDRYMDFVLLTKSEYDKLIKRFGEQGTSERIEALNNYIGSKGKKYASHYYTILVWNKRDKPKTIDTTEYRKRVANRSKDFH